MALTLLCVNLVVLGLGASFIAAITDFVFGNEAALAILSPFRGPSCCRSSSSF